jgi:hypothetical protein
MDFIQVACLIPRTFHFCGLTKLTTLYYGVSAGIDLAVPDIVKDIQYAFLESDRERSVNENGVDIDDSVTFCNQLSVTKPYSNLCLLTQ